MGLGDIYPPPCEGPSLGWLGIFLGVTVGGAIAGWVVPKTQSRMVFAVIIQRKLGVSPKARKIQASRHFELKLGAVPIGTLRNFLKVPPYEGA